MIQRWSKHNGYRDVLTISLPLVASMGSITLMQFTDRIFLANYSVEAIAAALPAGVASFTCLAFFMGVANYTNAFVAQYTGAKALSRVGAALWQGIYLSLFSAILLATLFFVSDELFALIGHSPSIQALEITYFNILILGAGLIVLNSAMACFYTGRGLTWVVMFVNMAGAAVNIPLDYCLINGVGPFPRLGIVGAGIATVTGCMDIGIILLRFVAVFCLFDALNLVFSGALKGAGDTRFIMWTVAGLSLGVMILPVYVAVEVLGAG
ncbi:MAG: MATE family efflux transporter, partial [Desulfatiglandaceae bacterium]